MINEELFRTSHRFLSYKMTWASPLVYTVARTRKKVLKLHINTTTKGKFTRRGLACLTDDRNLNELYEIDEFHR